MNKTKMLWGSSFRMKRYNVYFEVCRNVGAETKEEAIKKIKEEFHSLDMYAINLTKCYEESRDPFNYETACYEPTTNYKWMYYIRR
jgi:hypothetical protein